MCLRSCAAILLLSCCWPWLASADGSGGQPPATWAQLDATWSLLSAESRELLTQLTEQSLLIDELSESLQMSEQALLGLRASNENLKAELEILKAHSLQQQKELGASGAALTEARQELVVSQDSLRLVDKSLRASARSAFVRDLLIGVGAVGAGMLIGALIL